jgi:hypothetical protein
MSALTAPGHIAMTRNFIDQNPVEVELVRSRKVATGTGGYTKGSELLAERKLRARLVAAIPRSTVTDKGDTVVIVGSLICLPDANIEKGDQFLCDNKMYEVDHVNTSPPWRVEAEVFRHG